VSIIDANRLPPSSILNVDLCIVGAGAAGITLASELNGSGQSVCLVESGSYDPDEDTQSLYDLEIAGYPVRQNFMSRARYFGGTCNLWAGRSMKLTEFDLLKRDWVPNSGWPITYSELQRYYGKAERILKLPSLDAFENTTLQRRMSPSERTLFSNNDLKPNISLWAKKPLRFGAAYKSRLKRSRNVTVYLNANITEVTLAPGGHAVAEVQWTTLSGNRARVKAGRFVLACGGLENARLLLVSRSVQANGIGNQFDLVGRFFMDHPRTVYGKIRLSGKQKLPLLLGTPVREGIGQVGIQLSENVQRKERLLNNYLSLERHWSPQTAKAYSSFIYSMKILLRKGYSGKRFTLSGVKLAKIPELIYLLSPRELMPHPLYRVFKAVREKWGKDLTELTIVNYCEQVPNPASRVRLSQKRDRLNMNRLILDWKVGTEETQTLARVQSLVDHHLRKNHMGYVEAHSDEMDHLSYTDASHHIGTTRMSDNPRQGVVDVNCKVHGVGNLFIAGSSVFPTCGYANPTWTIVALALRLADHLKRISR
jgi:choline dehydrogenase-like flavoprotein